MTQELIALIGIMITFLLITIASFAVDKKRQGVEENGN